ncbi:MAG: hypothetical protein ABSG16_14210 [Candidatus Acidiferrum sp.]|jgi:hypothetical protein
MARIEFQISTPLLLEAVQHILEPRIYGTCFASPISEAILDRVAIDVQGPVTQPSHLNNTGVYVAATLKLYLVTPADVAAAHGGPSTSWLTPGGLPLTVNILASIAGTKLTAEFDSIVHNQAYDTLKTIIAGYVGSSSAAQQLLTQWEGVFKHTLSPTSLVDFDIKSVLPSQFKNLPNGRSALCANATVLAVRFEVGSRGSDGNWHDFTQAKLQSIIGDDKWALYISGDALVQVAENLISGILKGLFAGVAGKSKALPFGLSGQFQLLPVSGTTAFSPLQPVAAETAALVTTATLDFSLTIKFAGETVTRVAGDISFICTSLFTLSRHEVNSHQQPFLEVSLSYTVQDNVEVSWVGIAADFPQLLRSVSIEGGFAGFDATSVPNYFISSTALPPVVLGDVLTLTAAACRGAVYPPISAADQSDLARLGNGSLPPGQSIALPGSGLLISGKSNLNSTMLVPDCVVSGTPFVLTFIEESNAPGFSVPAKPAYVPAIATLTVSNKGPQPAKRYPLVVGAYTPYADPASQWSVNPHERPPTPLRVTNTSVITITIPESDFLAEYFNDPYPMSLIVCSNGGARLVSFAAIEAPIINPATGYVTNAQAIVVLNQYQGNPPSGPSHPVVSNQPPGG